MKQNAAFASSLLLAVLVGVSTSALFAETKAPAAKSAPAAKPAAPAAAAEEKVAEEEATIPGQVIERKSGGFISLSIEGGAFKLAFYDKEKQEVAPDVARATVRWDPKYKQGQERRVLNPSGDGKTLVSPAVRPPYQFKVFLNLLSADDTAVESYVVDFKG